MIRAIDILRYYGLSDMLSDENSLAHIGVGWFDNPPGVGSSRYPYGSGKNPYQHVHDLMGRIAQYESEGLTEGQIAALMKCTTKSLRAQKTLASKLIRSEQVAKAEKLREKGYSLRGIAKEMGIPEPTVRSLLDQDRKARMDSAMEVANTLKQQVDEKGIIDVGKGNQHFLGISSEKMDVALEILKLYGYEIYEGSQSQITSKDRRTPIKALCVPGTPYADIYDPEKVKPLDNIISYDDGETFVPGFAYPESMDSSRLMIRYPSEGGKDKDGLVEIRRNVSDLDLQKDNYAQVRILVDGTHYIKGMAVYGKDEDFPDGVDVIFNTSKPDGTKLKGVGKEESVLKKIKEDPENPFGALIKDQEHGGQYYWTDENGVVRLGLINKRASEGDWDKWAKSLPAQFLAKQPLELIVSQLGIAEREKRDELDEILNLNNETVKKKLLLEFADSCDSDAAQLQAAALPRQRYQVILPCPSLKDGEVYAPNYNDGEIVALIRYPHGGPFEIPILKVNNKNKEGLEYIGPNAKDAVGINAATAAILSGADFDGDTVQVIPCNSSRSKVHIIGTDRVPPLEGLKDYDPKVEYPKIEGMRYMSKEQTQKEMGIVTNLITDMTLKAAPLDEIALAVRHSMTVIDAEKHKLNYKKSERDNRIDELKETYQAHIGEDGKVHYGASTLISRANADARVAATRGKPDIDPKTGELIWKPAKDLYYEETKPVPVKDPANPSHNLKDANGNTIYETYVNAKGETKQVRVKTGNIKRRDKIVPGMDTVKDAFELSSGTTKEVPYAEYANFMKGLANEARKEYMVARTRTPRVNKEAKEKYIEEVRSLNDKLLLAEQNSPRERQAQRLAHMNAKVRIDAIGEAITNAEKKKINQQELNNARRVTGAKRTLIDITDGEWEAIQNHAISDAQLAKMLDYTDPDKIRQRATPNEASRVTTAQQNKIARLKDSGKYTNAEIAEAAGVSVSTVTKYTSGNK